MNFFFARRAWTTISAEDYGSTFGRFGGSFVLHPRVIALVSSLAKRPVRYAGLIREGERVAAVPLWGKHIFGTMVALEFYGQSHLVDFGHSEIVLPVAEDVRISIPFVANSISSLHAGNISNLKPEKNFALMLAKGLRIGDHLLSAKTKSEWRRLTRRFQDAGGSFHPVRDFSADEVAVLYTRLFEKRWGVSPVGKDLLPTVLKELKDMLYGDVLFIDDRPVAIELMYRNETSRCLFANGVNRGLDPEFRDYSLGGILNLHNIVGLEDEAGARKKMLRYSFGRNDAPYKALWSFENPAYRLPG